MKHTRKGNFFSLPNEVFLLGLSPGELAVYSYLRRCENRKSHQCWPSYKTIGEAVGMSENTVRKYTLRLEERGLITSEPTKVITRNGQKRNGNLLYTILPIQEVINHSYERQMVKLEEVTERQKVAEELRKQGRVRPCEPLCAILLGAAGTEPARAVRTDLGRLLRADEGRKSKQDKEQASSVTPCSVTSARSAGSYGSLQGVPKWGQNRRGDITSAVVIPESLQPQRKNGGHTPERKLL